MSNYYHRPMNETAGQASTSVRALLESKQYETLNEEQARQMTTILSNTERELKTYLTESVVTQDIASYSPILLPLIRYVYPRLIAHELLGVQPLKTPRSLIFSMVSEYRPTPTKSHGELRIYKLNTPVTEEVGEEIDGETLYHKEDDFVVVTIKNGKKAVNDAFGGYQVQEVYSNVASFPKVLRNWSEADITDEVNPKINDIGFKITSKTVAVKPRSLRGSYSVELYQDLKSQHGQYADNELMRLIANEIQSDIDSDVVNFVNTNSRQLPDWDATAYYNRGFNSVQVARELALKIAHEASRIAKQTNRGIANVCLCSPAVANLLATLDSYAGGPVKSDLTKVGVQTGFMGTLDGRLRIIVDPYSTYDYCTVLYKGDNFADTMGYFCPYVPLMFQKLSDFQTGALGIIGRSRYALTTIPGFESEESNDRASLYATTFSVTGV